MNRKHSENYAKTVTAPTPATQASVCRMSIQFLLQAVYFLRKNTRGANLSIATQASNKQASQHKQPTQGSNCASNESTSINKH